MPPPPPSAGDWRVFTTRARLTQRLEPDATLSASSLVFDFSDRLLFNWIDEVMYSVTFDDGEAIVGHAARTSVNTTVRVDFDAATAATVTVEVTQCPYK